MPSGRVTGSREIRLPKAPIAWLAPYVAPMGSPSLGFPGADRHLATAAQAARLPYTLSAVGGMTIEEAATVAPDVLWFQLPRLPRDNHKIGCAGEGDMPHLRFGREVEEFLVDFVLGQS